MTSEMELVFGVDGVARCIYDEGIDLREIGTLKITRASHVEPDADGYWWADMGPVDGPVLGPYGSRTEALGAERGWLASGRVLSAKACTQQSIIYLMAATRQLGCWQKQATPQPLQRSSRVLRPER
jgi:hypothetical protein